jgi:hypothetical protein
MITREEKCRNTERKNCRKFLLLMTRLKMISETDNVVHVYIWSEKNECGHGPKQILVDSWQPR